MSKSNRRQVMCLGAAMGASLIAGTVAVATEPAEISQIDLWLPLQLKKRDITDERIKEKVLTKIEYSGHTSWLMCVNMGFGVAHYFIGFYAPEKEGTFRRILTAESWELGNFKVTVNAKTGMLEMRDDLNWERNGELVLAFNLKSIGTVHSIKK